MRYYVLSFLLLCLFVVSCRYDNVESRNNKGSTNNPNPNPCDTTAMSYQSDIAPILTQNNCTLCHTSGSINLTNYTGVKAQIDANRLLGAIEHKPNFAPMPNASQKISACEIEQIKAWVRQGTLNN